jgi:hypothetical protein
MRAPRPIEFTAEEQRFIDETGEEIASWFDAHLQQEEMSYNTMTTEPLMPDHVWREIVRQANKAGYDADLRGSEVTFRRPQQGPDRSPGTVG